MGIKSIKFILSNILPVHVAEIYFTNKQGDELFTEEFSLIAVMFASVTNYDSQQTGIRVLNDIICHFDDMLYKYEGLVEKIKVAGWTYMAACGLDKPDPLRETESLNASRNIDLRSSRSTLRFSSKEIVVDEMTSNDSAPINNSTVELTEDEYIRVVRMTSFALDLIRVMYEMAKNNLYSESGPGLRVGISFGPVMAGVVGRTKPHYDIWGHTVNMASRLESTGIENMVQVTSETAYILKSYNISCAFRDYVDIKGVGKVPTYTVDYDHDLNFVKFDPNVELPQFLNRNSGQSIMSIKTIDLNINTDSESNFSDSDSEHSLNERMLRK